MVKRLHNILAIVALVENSLTSPLYISPLSDQYQIVNRNQDSCWRGAYVRCGVVHYV